MTIKGQTRRGAALKTGGGALGGALLVLGIAGAPATAQPAKKVPYWAALSKDEARMRVGPSMDYPANWLYRRRDLPVKVVETYPNWRKIEDPDGTMGWVHVRLLKDDPTAIVRGGIAEMHDGPSGSAPVLFRLEPGVVGKISGCAGGWCGFDVHGRRGYVLARSLWGATE